MSRTTLIDLAVVLLCALLLRAPMLMQPSRPLSGDEPDYYALARHLEAGKGFTQDGAHPTAYRTPGLPLLLCALFRMTGDDLNTTRVILTIVSALTALALYGLGMVLLHRRSIALLAGMIWAFLPTSRRLAGLLMGEPLAALFVTLGLLLTILADRRRSTVLAAAAGFVWGYAVLTRAYLILALAGPAVWLAGGRSRRQAAAFLVSAALILGGWGWRNAIRMHTFTLSTQTSSLWLGNNAWARGSVDGVDEPQLAYLAERYPGFPAMNEVDQARIYTQAGTQEIREHPGRIMWLLPRKALIFLSPSSYLGFDWLYALLAPFALVGLWRLGAVRERRRELWLLAWPVLGVLLVCLMNLGDPRFRHPVDPLVIVAACFSVAELASRVVARFHAPRPVTVSEVAS